jgi:hypothetical protein
MAVMEETGQEAGGPGEPPHAGVGVGTPTCGVRHRCDCHSLLLVDLEAGQRRWRESKVGISGGAEGAGLP